MCQVAILLRSVFFFIDTATIEIYTLSLHDALPISFYCAGLYRAKIGNHHFADKNIFVSEMVIANLDRKSTRLNSSHANISYAVFCLKKKKTKMFEISEIEIYVPRRLCDVT